MVAVEDQNFWTHDGVDPEAIIRAALSNFEHGDTVEGGSTITQQYVKNTYTTGERNLSRKLREALLASRLGGRWTGRRSSSALPHLDLLRRRGVRRRRRRESYFLQARVRAHRLRGGRWRAPSRRPTTSTPGNAEVAERRRIEALRKMRDQGYLTLAEFRGPATSTSGTPPSAAAGPGDRRHPPPDDVQTIHPYFVDYVRRYLLEHFDHRTVYRAGCGSRPPRPEPADPGPAGGQLHPDGTAPPLEMSLVTVDPTNGHVRAMVGGPRDFAQNQVNLALGGTPASSQGRRSRPSCWPAFRAGDHPRRRVPGARLADAAELHRPVHDPNAEPGNGGVEDLRQATAHP